jgi:hypothetical protein
MSAFDWSMTRCMLNAKLFEIVYFLHHLYIMYSNIKTSPVTLRNYQPVAWVLYQRAIDQSKADIFIKPGTVISMPIYPLQRVFYPKNRPCTSKIVGTFYIQGYKVKEKTFMILIIAEFIYQDSIIIDKSIFFMYIQSSK